MNRISKCLLIAALLLMPASVFAQTETSEPLPLGELVRGTLTDVGDQIVYRFEVPEGQDVVVRLEADRVVMVTSCVRSTSATVTEEDCPERGGRGGSDSPIISHFLFPGDDNPETRKTVELTLSRPLEGSANYDLEAQVLTPRSLALGEPLNVNAVEGGAFQSYSIEANATLPFTVTVEEDNPSAALLWVAFEPYKPSLFTNSAERLLSAQLVDSVQVLDAEALQMLTLYYVGGTSFRLLVGAAADYSIRGTAVDITPLDEGESLPLTLDYREPLTVVRTASDGAGAISLEIELTEGAEASIYVYALEDPFPGGRRVSASELPRLTIDLEGSAAGQFVVVQLPFEHTRDPVQVEVAWQTQD